MTATLLLIDTPNVYAKARWKLGDLSRADGTLTGGLYGAIRAVRSAVDRFGPDEVVLAFEGGDAPSWRRSVFPEYKADRPPDRGTFVDGHMDALKEWASLAGHVSAWAPGLEADDVIAFMARRYVERGGSVVVVSADHDFRQLLGPRVTLCRDSTRGELYTAMDLERDIGCPPEQYRAVLAIAGDPSDHIDGVKGVGPKTAVKILSEAGWDLFVACQHPRLAPSFEKIMRNHELVNFHPAPAMMVRQPAPGDIDGFYARWEFRSLMSEDARVASMGIGGGP